MSTTFTDSDQLQIVGNPAILMGVQLPERSGISEQAMLEELGALAETAGAQVVGHTTQRMQRPNDRTFCGKGKAEELGEMVKETGAQLVIFDNELKPHHQRVLGDITGARVVDRTELILLIFAEHARTHQAKLAVELARLQYQLPRLRHMWSHLERQRGRLATVGGAGERQIETDRRIIRDRITKLKKELGEIEKRRVGEVKRRGEHFKIALVGYTNAGKSTLMKQLTDADVYIADQLFATLDTRTRVWEFEGHKVLLSDTVGFIRELPHDLVAGFNATLAETIHADLLLHVVDASHPDALEMIAAVEAVLEELEAHEVPRLMVLNKVDRLENQAVLTMLKEHSQESYQDCIALSAVTGEGVDAFRKQVAALIEEHESLLEFSFSAGNGKLLAFLNERCKMLEQQFEGDQVHVRVIAEPRHLQKIDELLGYDPSRGVDQSEAAEQAAERERFRKAFGA